MPGRNRQARGYTYVAVLLLVALHGIILGVGGAVWSTAHQRDKERELLFVGDQFRRAIRSYAQSGPGLAGQLPRSLDDLLRDPRFPGTKRHLRRIFVDPMTGSTHWGLVMTPDGRSISGVYSRSRDTPVKRAGFEGDDRAFEGAASYSEWKFEYRTPSRPPAAPATAPRPKAATASGNGRKS